MNHLIVFLIVISIYFGLNESWTVVPWGCKDNTLEFRNELAPNSILKVNCTSKDNTISVHDVLFNGKYEFSFGACKQKNNMEVSFKTRSISSYLMESI
ncbi:putative plant self-incompatibility S1 [Arabidopsis thaliana]